MHRQRSLVDQGALEEADRVGELVQHLCRADRVLSQSTRSGVAVEAVSGGARLLAQVVPAKPTEGATPATDVVLRHHLVTGFQLEIFQPRTDGDDLTGPLVTHYEGQRGRPASFLERPLHHLQVSAA